MSEKLPLKKIISGGQTGADQGGLEAALDLGLKTGGTAPKGFRTEHGHNPALWSSFGLEEHASREYAPRTRQNIEDSDMTFIFGDTSSAGSAMTIRLCNALRKPCFTNPSTHKIRTLLANVKVLNIAGNRESKSPGIQARVRTHLNLALKGLVGK